MKCIKIFLTLGACFLFVFTTGWSEPSAFAQDKIPLRVGYLPILAQLPLIVSYQNDRMRVEKIDLKLVRYNSFTTLEAALRVGAVDVASLPVTIALSKPPTDTKSKLLGNAIQVDLTLYQGHWAALKISKENWSVSPGSTQMKTYAWEKFCQG